MDTKPWWQSKTIWGGLVQAIVITLALLHVDISDQAENLTNGLYAAAGLAGAVLVIVGRVRARKVISSETLPPPGSPLMKLLLLTSVLGLLTSGCAQGPVYPTSAAAKVGNDFTVAAAAAIQAFVEHRDGDTDMAWSLSKGLTAYQTFVKSSADIKELAKAWTGNAGDSQKLADKLARIFAASPLPPEVKTAALVHVTQSVASDRGP